MATLYELKNEFKELLELAEDAMLDQKTLNDTLEIVGLELEAKAEGYAMVMKQLEGNVGMIDKEIERLNYRKKILKNNISAMKNNLEVAMVETGKTKFKTDLFSFGIQKNPPSVEILNESKIPDIYYVEQEPKLDRRFLLDRLREIGDTEFARIKQTESLRIR